MSKFREALQAYSRAMTDPAAERLLASITTRSQAQLAFDAFEAAGEDASRTIGCHVADNADEIASHPWESAGAAMIRLDDGFAIFAEWDNQGFWSVDFPTIANAEKEIEALNLEWSEEEEGCEEYLGEDY